MKKFLAVMAIIALFWAAGSWIGAQIEVTTSTVITIASRAVDDTGTYVTPDSVNIVVYFEGAEAFDAWFVAADGECDELNSQLVFFDAFGDIDGGAGTGIYQVSANFKEDDDEYWVNTWYRLVDTTDQAYGSIIYWKADSVSGAVADANKVNFKATDVNVASVDPDAFDAPAFADDAQYMIYGGAIWVDTTNGTAGAVVGVNGLPSLPCRGFVNAKAIADAIGVHTFCVLGGGDQSIKATMNGYTFMGIGDPTRNKVDLNSQDVGGSMFIDLDITGIQGGARAAFLRCALEDASLDAVALQCGLRGDITLLGDRDNIFIGCVSSVPGDKTPSLIFSGGSESVQFRGYSGGLHLYGMGSNDSLSFEAIGGQLQVGAGVNVNAKITARGMITVTDSTAGLNKLTYVATAQYAVDSTMNAITDVNKANFKATGFATSTQGDSVTQAIADANKPNFADTANQCDMVMISGDATAADNLEFAFEDGGGWLNLFEPTNNVKHIYVKTDGDDDSSGLTWAGARANVDTAVDACWGADAYIIHVAPGTYASQNPTLDVNYVWLKGAGKEKTILQNSGGVIIVSSNTVGCRISGFTLDGIIEGASTYYGIYARGDQIEIFDNRIIDVSKGIYLQYEGVGDPLEYAFVHHNVIEKCSLDYIVLDNADFCVISDNIMDTLNHSLGNPILLHTGSSYNKIIHNYIKITAGEGIEQSTDAVSNFIADNYIWAADGIDPMENARSSFQAYVGNQGRTGRSDTTSTLQDDIAVVADTANAILDSIQAHAPHGDDWASAGSVDTASIARSVWDDDVIAQASRTVTASCAGSGARTVVIQTLDYTDSTTGISEVMIDVYDSTGGGYKAGLQSNTAGFCTLSLDDGRYTIHLKKTADAIDGGSPQYKGVASDTTHTFYVDQFDPGAPPSADKCRVWCIAYDLSGNELPGARLSIWVPDRFMPLVYDDRAIISRYSMSATSNDTGYVAINIYEMEGADRIKCNADTTLTVKAYIELHDPSGDLISRTYKAIPDASDYEIVW